ncbi:MAG: response regulator [Flavobacterium sp.]|nr:response regulator [Flavobacterium sp.]
MPKKDTIVLIEDDSDDKVIFEMITRELGYENEIKWFTNSEDAMNFLCAPHDALFLIFCDINLPGRSGLQLKKDIDAIPYLRKKSIPFLFYSTNASQEEVDTAYTQMTVQGFFLKGHDYNKIKVLLKTIYDYWSACRHPNMQ